MMEGENKMWMNEVKVVIKRMEERRNLGEVLKILNWNLLGRGEV